jgi:hypothetical protein
VATTSVVSCRVVLCCVVLCCVVLCCVVSCCVVLCCVVLCCVVLCSVVLCCVVLCCVRVDFILPDKRANILINSHQKFKKAYIGSFVIRLFAGHKHMYCLFGGRHLRASCGTNDCTQSMDIKLGIQYSTI